MKKYERKYERDKKKYVGNMKIRTLLIYGPWDLEKFRDHPLISGRRWFAISRFRGTPEKRHETCQFLASLKASIGTEELGLAPLWASTGT